MTLTTEGDSRVLTVLFQHNTWANLKMLESCSILSDEQLDAQPLSITKGTIRRTLEHLVFSEAAYVNYLTGQKRPATLEDASFAVFFESTKRNGQALLELAQNVPQIRIQTKDGYMVEPWVLYVQIINHATEHREQISSMLTAQGITPPDLDGWSYGEATNALFPPENAPAAV